jgi:hypothetical protein
VENLLNTYWELPDLCSLLGQLDLANAFLVSIGGHPDTRLPDFLTLKLSMKYQMRNSTVRSVAVIELSSTDLFLLCRLTSVS